MDSEEGPAWTEDIEGGGHCDCFPGPPPEFVIPPPPAPLGACHLGGCALPAAKPAAPLGASPYVPLAAVCSSVVLVALCVGAYVVWKHRRKSQDFMQSKDVTTTTTTTTSQGQARCSGSNGVTYDDMLINHHPTRLPASLQGEDTAPVAPVELLGVKFGTNGNAVLRLTSNPRVVENPNPIYEEVERKTDSCESEDSEDGGLAEDESSLAEFPQPCSGSSSVLGSTGGDLSRDSDSEDLSKRPPVQKPLRIQEERPPQGKYIHRARSRPDVMSQMSPTNEAAERMHPFKTLANPSKRASKGKGNAEMDKPMVYAQSHGKLVDPFYERVPPSFYTVVNRLPSDSPPPPYTPYRIVSAGSGNRDHLISTVYDPHLAATLKAAAASRQAPASTKTWGFVDPRRRPPRAHSSTENIYQDIEDEGKPRKVGSNHWSGGSPMPLSETRKGSTSSGPHWSPSGSTPVDTMVVARTLGSTRPPGAIM